MVRGEGGVVIYQRNYGPEVEGEDKDKVWTDTYQQVQFNGPNDKIGYKNIYNMHDGSVTEQSMLPEYKAQNDVMLKAIEFQAEQRQAAAAAQASTGADSMKSANEAVAQITIAYESNARPRPEFDIGGVDDAATVQVAQQKWDEGLLAFKKRWLTREQQVALGLIESGEGLGQAQFLDTPNNPQPAPQAQQPAPNEGAAFDNKLNFLNSMNI
jgi:hypothetical protein